MGRIRLPAVPKLILAVAIVLAALAVGVAALAQQPLSAPTPQPPFPPPPYAPQPHITPQCFSALHNSSAYAAVAHACIPRGSWYTSLNERAVFKAVASYPLSDVLMRDLYTPNGQLGEIELCWKDRIEEHNEAFCSDECESAFAEFYRGLTTACEGSVLIHGLDQYQFHPPPWRPGSYEDFATVWAGRFQYGEAPTCPPQAKQGNQGPPAPSFYPTQHDFTGFLLDNFDRRRNVTADLLRQMSELARSGFCAKMEKPATPQASAPSCAVEARQILGPGRWISATVPTLKGGKTYWTELAYDKALTDVYFGDRGRTYEEACSCAATVMSSLPPHSWTPLPPVKREAAKELQKLLCSKSGPIKGESLNERMLPTLTAPCVSALHDQKQYARVVDACVSESGRDAGDGLAARFQAVLTHGSMEAVTTGLYWSREGYDGCWKDRVRDHTEAFCQTTCESALNDYFSSLESACGTQAFRPVVTRLPLFLFFSGRKWRGFPPFTGGGFFGIGPPDVCPPDRTVSGFETRTRPMFEHRFRDTEQLMDYEMWQKHTFDDFISTFPDSQLSSMSDFDRRIAEEFGIWPKGSDVHANAPSVVFRPPHNPLVVLFQLVNQDHAVDARALSAAMNISRAALCARTMQTSDWFTKWEEPKEGFCEVEAWRVVGASMGNMNSMFGRPGKYPWGWRDGQDKFMFGPWPLYRDDADSCRCMNKILDRLPNLPEGFLTPRSQLWLSITLRVCA